MSLTDSLSPFYRYFIFADTCLITQYIYFQTLQHRKERLLRLPHQRLSPGDPLYRHAVRRPASVDEVPPALHPYSKFVTMVGLILYYRQPTAAECHVLLHYIKHAAAQRWCHACHASCGVQTAAMMLQEAGTMLSSQQSSISRSSGKAPR